MLPENILPHQPYKRHGDKKNSDFFEEYLLKIYAARDKAGLTANIRNIKAVMVQVDLGQARNYICELLVMSNYNYVRSFEDETYRYHLLRINEKNPDFIVRERLSEVHDSVWCMNQLSPNGQKKPYTRYIGEIVAVQDLEEVYLKLKDMNVRFEKTLPESRGEHFIQWTQPSVYTWNQIGYVADKKVLDYEKKSDFHFSEEDLALFKKMKEVQKDLGISQYILPVDHLATRVFCHDREHAILEYLMMSAYYLWGAYDISDQNSSTNVTRNVHGFPEYTSPAKVFTANNTPYYVNHIVGLPSPTEDFVRNFSRRMHHIAYAVVDGLYGKPEDDYQNVDFVVDQLKKAEKQFLLHVIGSCQEGLKQIFSKASPYSYLITEYIQRCDDYDGFFTKENVAALTMAAGEDETVKEM